MPTATSPAAASNPSTGASTTVTPGPAPVLPSAEELAAREPGDVPLEAPRLLQRLGENVFRSYPGSGDLP